MSLGGRRARGVALTFQTLFWMFQCMPWARDWAMELLSPGVGKGERMPVLSTGTSRLAMLRLPVRAGVPSIFRDKNRCDISGSQSKRTHRQEMEAPAGRTVGAAVDHRSVRAHGVEVCGAVLDHVRRVERGLERGDAPGMQPYFMIRTEDGMNRNVGESQSLSRFFTSRSPGAPAGARTTPTTPRPCAWWSCSARSWSDSPWSARRRC
jgi:hypothetical protein